MLRQHPAPGTGCGKPGFERANRPESGPVYGTARRTIHAEAHSGAAESVSSDPARHARRRASSVGIAAWVPDPVTPLIVVAGRIAIVARGCIVTWSVIIRSAEVKSYSAVPAAPPVVVIATADDDVAATAMETAVKVAAACKSMSSRKVPATREMAT